MPYPTDWFSTFLIVTGVAAGLLFLVFMVYFVGSIANSAYQMRVEMRNEMTQRFEAIRREIDKEVGRRAQWIRNDAMEEVRRHRAEIEDHVRTHEAETMLALDNLRREIAALREIVERDQARLDEQVARRMAASVFPESRS